MQRLDAGSILGGLLAFLLVSTQPLAAQQLSPDLLSLRDLIAELAELEPPLDPSDQASIVADTQTALTNLSGSTVPYAGVPESLYGARLGMRVANLLYHRFGAPHDASTVLTSVQSVYAAYPAGASTMSATVGKSQTAASNLPSSFTPASSASTTNPCSTNSPNLGLLHDLAFQYLIDATIRLKVEGTWVTYPYDPVQDPAQMSVVCRLGSGVNGDTSFWFDVGIPSQRTGVVSTPLVAYPTASGGGYQIQPGGTQ